METLVTACDMQATTRSLDTATDIEADVVSTEGTPLNDRSILSSDEDDVYENNETSGGCTGKVDKEKKESKKKGPQMVNLLGKRHIHTHTYIQETGEQYI